MNISFPLVEVSGKSENRASLKDKTCGISSASAVTSVLSLLLCRSLEALAGMAELNHGPTARPQRLARSMGRSFIVGS